MINDPVVYKTEVVRGTNSPNFKFNKQFNFQATTEVTKYEKILKYLNLTTMKTFAVIV